MICSSSPVPSVVTTSDWVSPRVNSEEPGARQNAGPGDDRAHGAVVAAVDAGAAVDDVAAQDARFQLLDRRTEVLVREVLFGQARLDQIDRRGNRVGALLLSRSAKAARISVSPAAFTLSYSAE